MISCQLCVIVSVFNFFLLIHEEKKKASKDKMMQRYQNKQQHKL